MSLIKSISGIRGTIGGPAGDTLNPLDIVKFTSAYATFIRQSTPSGTGRIVVGRDARISGEMVRSVVCGTLLGMGYDVIDIGLATTPTTELAVTMSGADGGIIITASHNPRHWNALKLLNNQGEFLSATDGNKVLTIASDEAFEYADVDHLGHYTQEDYNERHVDAVMNLKLVDAAAIKQAHFNVVVDSINSVGGIILPQLLDRLGVSYTFLNGEANGDFAHNPEPLEKNLGGIMDTLKSGGYDLGIVAFRLPASTPWRTITVGADLKPIVETTVMWDYVEPLYAPSREYEYGRSTWSWIVWQDASCNWDDQIKFIDLASEMGWEYILVDAGWDENIGYDRMEQLIKYANSKKVDVFLWYSSSGYWNDIVQRPTT